MSNVNESSVAALPNDGTFNWKIQTEKEKTVAELRQMLNHLAGNDKCTACKALRELEKKEQPQNSAGNSLWLMAFMTLLLFSDGWAGNGAFDDEIFLKAFTKALDETREEKERENREKEANNGK